MTNLRHGNEPTRRVQPWHVVVGVTLHVKENGCFNQWRGEWRRTFGLSNDVLSKWLGRC